jgi:hypothetical protein
MRSKAKVILGRCAVFSPAAAESGIIFTPQCNALAATLLGVILLIARGIDYNTGCVSL